MFTKNVKCNNQNYLHFSPLKYMYYESSYYHCIIIVDVLVDDVILALFGCVVQILKHVDFKPGRTFSLTKTNL